MQCINPVRITKGLDVTRFPDGLLVGCGKCVMCRIAKRREWTLRLIHESVYWEDSVFLTLTYSDDYLPKNGSLDKRQLQLFIKRLRKSLNGRSIKYFACGEYGDNTERPHYHLIIFGISLCQEDKEKVMMAWPYVIVTGKQNI